MTHAVRFVASVNVLTALALCVPVQAQTPEIEALRARAEEGDASVQFNLGFRYGNGRSVPQDDAEAVRWYRLAADQGHVSAQYNLGVMYANGEGVPQDNAEAVRWYRLAADQGLAIAQSNLGVMYANGEGVPQDDVEAHMWTNLAAAQSSGELRDHWVKNRDIIAAKMTAEQIGEAQRRAREWNEAHPREP
jgi:TPR repeat protein